MNHLDAMTGIIFTPKVGTQSPVFFRAFSASIRGSVF